MAYNGISHVAAFRHEDCDPEGLDAQADLLVPASCERGPSMERQISALTARDCQFFGNPDTPIPSFPRMSATASIMLELASA